MNVELAHYLKNLVLIFLYIPLIFFIYFIIILVLDFSFSRQEPKVLMEALKTCVVLSWMEMGLLFTQMKMELLYFNQRCEEKKKRKRKKNQWKDNRERVCVFDLA